MTTYSSTKLIEPVISPAPVTTDAGGMILTRHRRRAADLDDQSHHHRQPNRARRTPRKLKEQTMLSDSCFDFLLHTSRGKPECETATTLLDKIERVYSKHPYNYSPEIIDRLRDAVQAFLKTETPETRAGLWRTTGLVRTFLDGCCGIVQRGGGLRAVPLGFEIWAPAELAEGPEEYEEAELRRHYLDENRQLTVGKNGELVVKSREGAVIP